MNYDRVSLWIQTFGVVAIVASLGLVVVEIRENTNAVAAQAVLGLNELASQQNFAMASNRELAGLVVRAQKDPDSLSAIDIAQLENLAWTYFNGQESAFTFYQKGIIDESDYAAWGLSTCEFWTGFGNFWATHRQYFNPEFVRDTESRCPSPAKVSQ